MITAARSTTIDNISLTRLGARYTIDPELPVEVRRRRLQCLNRFALLPSGTRVATVQAGGVPAEWVVPRGADAGPVLLFLHGGAYVGGSPTTHRVYVARLANAIGARALVPDYHLAPEHRFPRAIDDAVAVYAWLVGEQRFDPTRLVVAGDSAGGGLTLALTVSVRDAGGRLPRALACISPWTDLACTGESMRTRARFDPFYQPAGLALEARRYLGDANPKDPLASPLYADLHGLPPLLVQVGEDEVMLDDSRRLVERALAAGVDATLEVWPGMWHIFQMQGTFPESRLAHRRFARFLQRHLAGVPM